MKGIIKSIIPAVFILVVLLFGTSALAAGKCKDLSRSQCTANDSCTWVKGYTTKTGKKVAAYCRVKSGKKGTSDKASEKSKKDEKAGKTKEATKQDGNSSKKKSVKEQKSKTTDNKTSKKNTKQEKNTKQ